MLRNQPALVHASGPRNGAQETLLGAKAENEVNTEFSEPATAKINEAEIQVMAARIERFAGELELD